MKRITTICALVLGLLFSGTSLLHAQQSVTSYDFESYTVGDTLGSTGWNATDASAVVKDDTVGSSSDQALEVKIGNYNAAPYLEFVLPEGKSLADYDSLKFDGYFAQGDVGYKDIIAIVTDVPPSGGFANDDGINDQLGSVRRSAGGSSDWESIGIDIQNFRMSTTDTLYIAFGMNQAGTGNIGGSDVETIWYADNVMLQEKTDSTVVDVVINSADHDTLESAILAADLGLALSAEGPFTLFAPTDAAFAALEEGTLDALLADPSGDLRELLQYHVVGASALSGSLSNGQKLETLLGDSIEVTLDGGNVFIDGAQVTAADIETDNGVVHVLDAVLTPPADTTTVVDAIRESGNHTTLDSAITAAGLTETLEGEGPFTVFAPTDAAFDALPDGALDDLLADPTGELTDVLLYHVINGEVLAADLSDGQVVETLLAEDVTITINNDGVFINDAEVTTTDIEKGNGIVHVIDAVLTPPVAEPSDPGLVTQWGADANRNAWPILNDSNTPAGSASMGDTAAASNWATLRGVFDDVSAIEGNPFVITGKMEINGGLGNGYTPLRYALHHYEETPTLTYANTDSATFGNANSSGYSFMPISGTGPLANGNGGSGTSWWFAGSSFLSTYGNNAPMSTDEQVPSLGEMVAGTYDFAISVEPAGRFTNEIRYYLIHENEEYWFGGTVVDTSTTRDFNAITFGFQGVEGFTEVSVSEVTAGNANQIEVPLPPFESHYITQWGSDSRYTDWPMLRDTTDLDGDAGMGGTGEQVSANSWASIVGAFDYDVEAENGSALILRGEMTLNGSLGNGYTPLRYSLNNFEDLGELNNAYTDSAAWSQPSTNSTGYSFMPISGTGPLANGNGGSGTAWWFAGSNWLSTYGNNAPIGTFEQIPALAEMAEGTYEWAISVEPIDELTNEIRFIMIHEEDDYYFAGVTQDTAVTTTFNGFAFGFQGVEGFTQVDFEAVEVDKGDPIEIPSPAFYDHYIPQSRFGFLGGKYGGDWTLTPGEFTGDATVSGSAATDWAAIRGGFEVPYTPTSEAGEGLLIEGEVMFEGGGFEEDDSFLFGIYNAANPGMVDSTEERGYEWNGSEDMHTGYLFNPGAGTASSVEDGVWYDESAATELGSVSTSGTPTAGTYELSISAQPVSGGMEVNVILMKDDESFTYEASYLDANSVGTTFEGINFAVNNSSTTEMSIQALEIMQGELAVSNEAEPAEGLPVRFALEQNYPNPFNPTTNIGFDLPRAAEVELTVYNMLGQEVMTLVNNRMQAGSHKVTFDARSLASGMYVYRIKAGSFTSTKKMMLIK